MRTLILCLLLGLPLALSSAAAAPKPPAELPPLLLGQGEQRILRIPGLLKYSVGGPAIRVLRLPQDLAGPGDVTENTLLLKGVSPGVTDLWVWKSGGGTERRSIRVERVTRSMSLTPLERALSRLEEAEIYLSGEGAVLRGEVHTLAESARICALIEGFPKEIQDQTELSPGLLEEGNRRIVEWIRANRGASRLQVERTSGTIRVVGSLPGPSDREAAKREILARFPAARIEIDSFPDDAPTVYFRVFLLELKKNRFGSLGIEWPSSLANAFRVTTSGIIQRALQLDLAIQALEGEGSLKILSSPELVVRAPGEAELFAGGELPIHNQSLYSSNLTWRPYGLTLRLNVTHSSGDRVRLDVLTEVSHLDVSISQDSVPGLQTNRMKTQVDARYGEPLFLSGLLRQESREQARGLPFLGSIPVLGRLFSSKDYLSDRSELVAILLPHLAPPRRPMERVAARFPKGRVPSPRNWISPQKERELRLLPDFPWAALE